MEPIQAAVDGLEEFDRGLGGRNAVLPKGNWSSCQTPSHVFLRSVEELEQFDRVNGFGDEVEVPAMEVSLTSIPNGRQ